MPITPGSDGIIESEDKAFEIARKIGYPVMIKATAGGGGRGMRPVLNEATLRSLYQQASQEALKCFGNGSLYMEKLVEQSAPHRVPGRGGLPRQCHPSRRARLLHAAPQPEDHRGVPLAQALRPELRKRMGDATVKLCKEIGYENCGTIEYLVDDECKNFYFMEMNTRIQVEHPVTEEVYGCDLIKEQIRIAAGQPLSEHVLNEHARAATPSSAASMRRIPTTTSPPARARIDLWYAPGGRGVRVDTHVYSGYTVPPYYDSMIAKLIVTGATRDIAIRRMNRALGEFMIEGIKTTIPFQAKIITTSDFQQGKYDITWVENFLRQEGMKD